MVIPTYNERVNLPVIVPAVLQQDPRIEVLVVDDNSPDGTGAVADALAAESPRVHVLHREAKAGLGKAYLAGFTWALGQGYDLILEMDADFSHDPKFLPVLIKAAGAADLVHRVAVQGRGQRHQLADVPAPSLHRRQPVCPVDHRTAGHRLDWRVQVFSPRGAGSY